MTNPDHVALPRGTRPYFPALDGVRAIAALMIMLFHYSQLKGQSHLFVAGQTGVDLFFVLSGFLITTILLDVPSRDWHEVRHFYIRRSLRIFPLYYGYLAVAACLSKVSVWYWFYLQNIALSYRLPITDPLHFWSLAVEEHFYLFWPFLMLFLPRRFLGTAMCAVLLMSTACRAMLAFTSVDVFYSTVTRLDGLAAGGLIALANSRGKLQLLRPALGVMSMTAGVLLVSLVLRTHGQALPAVQILKPTLTTALYGGIIALLVATESTGVHRMLSAKPLRAIGKVSYGLYVYHQIVFTTLSKRLWHAPALAMEVVSFLVVYAVAWVSWTVFESHFISLKQRWAPERRFRNQNASNASTMKVA